MRLKATKTSLYKLVAECAEPHAMIKTTFTKAHRHPSYWLRWRADGISYEAYLTACMGKPLLAIEAKEYNEETGHYQITNRQTYGFTRTRHDRRTSDGETLTTDSRERKSFWMVFTKPYPTVERDGIKAELDS